MPYIKLPLNNIITVKRIVSVHYLELAPDFVYEGESHDFPDYFFEKRIHRIRRPAPCREDLAELVEASLASKRPMVICGGGVRYSEAGAALEAFCHTFKIPFAETQAGKSA